jgi:hypothetical protein
VIIGDVKKTSDPGPTRKAATLASKKAHSLARKAKKEAQQAASSSDNGSGDNAALDGSSCKHIKLPESCRLYDFKEA